MKVLNVFCQARRRCGFMRSIALGLSRLGLRLRLISAAYKSFERAPASMRTFERYVNSLSSRHGPMAHALLSTIATSLQLTGFRLPVSPCNHS